MWLSVRAFYARKNFGGKALLVNQVHDAVYVDADAAAAKEAATLLHACMEGASDFISFLFKWDIPIPVPSDTTWGDSMMDEGILDGDIILVEERPDPHTGEVVVAVVDGEATVKRFYREKNGSVRLQPSNASFKPIIVEDGDLKIRGAVVGLIRKYH